MPKRARGVPEEGTKATQPTPKHPQRPAPAETLLRAVKNEPEPTPRKLAADEKRRQRIKAINERERTLGLDANDAAARWLLTTEGADTVEERESSTTETAAPARSTQGDRPPKAHRRSRQRPRKTRRPGQPGRGGTVAPRAGRALADHGCSTQGHVEATIASPGGTTVLYVCLACNAKRYV